MKTFVAFFAAALVAAPGALADGFAAPAAQLGTGVLSADGSVRYVAAPAFDNTSLLAIETESGLVVNETQILGSYGIPVLSFRPAGFHGLSADGRTLVLADTAYRSTSHFLVYDTRTFGMKDGFSLKGTYGFDALSPDGSTVYLIQYSSAQDQQHYVVRAYDLPSRRLLPGRIADRAQKSWVMQGTALTRTTTADGRWVYTLYSNPGGYPFIHALDTVGRTAHCIGLPWQGTDQSALSNLVLAAHGRSLDVHWRSGKPWYRVDTATWRVAAAHGGGFPWLWVAIGGAISLTAMELGRRRRSNTPVSVQGGSDGPTARARARRAFRGRPRSARSLSRAVRGTGRERRPLERRQAELRRAQGR
jgi:hypothetical protein